LSIQNKLTTYYAMNYEINNNIITASLNNDSYRMFRGKITKNKTRRIKWHHVIIKRIVCEKLANGDYCYLITDTQLVITVEFNEDSEIKLYLEEVFEPIDLNLMDPYVKLPVICLQNQINYLKSKLTCLTGENDALVEDNERLLKENERLHQRIDYVFEPDY